MARRFGWMGLAALAGGLALAPGPSAAAGEPKPEAGGVCLLYKVEPAELRGAAAAVLTRRLDGFGLVASGVTEEGPDHLAVTAEGSFDAERLRSVIERPGELAFHLVTGPGEGTEDLPAADGSTRTVEAEPLLVGARLADAEFIGDLATGQPAVLFTFDEAGTKAFAEVTKAHIGDAVAIVVDGVVVSAPYIVEPILKGQGQISGTLTADDVRELVALLRGGALPAGLKLNIEEATEAGGRACAPAEGPKRARHGPEAAFARLATLN